MIRYPDLASNVRGLASQQQFLKSPHTELITNLSYATAIAWMIYRRNNLCLAENPSPCDLAKCWFDFYNTRDNANQGTNCSDLDKFVKNFNKFVLGEKKGMAA